MRVNTVSLYRSLYCGGAAITLPFGTSNAANSGMYKLKMQTYEYFAK